MNKKQWETKIYLTFRWKVIKSIYEELKKRDNNGWEIKRINLTK